MRLTELTVDIADLDHISQEQFQSRSVGLHVSQIIRHILLTSGLEEKSDFTEDDLGMFAVVGRLWEEMLSRTLWPAPRYIRPGEVELDGIIGSPDGVDTVDPAVVEAKVTWKSSNRAIESFFKYMLQIKAYAYMLGVTRVRLCVFYVCGDYKPPLPQIRMWDIEFNQHELKDNWRILVRNGMELK